MLSTISPKHPFFKLLNVNNIKEVIKDDIRITRLLVGNKVHPKDSVDYSKEKIINASIKLSRFVN